MRVEYLDFDLLSISSFFKRMRYAFIFGIIIITAICIFTYFQKKDIRYFNVILKATPPTYQQNKLFYGMLSILDENIQIDQELLNIQFRDYFNDANNVMLFFLESDLLLNALKNRQILDVTVFCSDKQQNRWIEEYILSCSFTFLEGEADFLINIPIRELFQEYVNYIDRKTMDEFKRQILYQLNLREDILKKKMKQLMQHRENKEFGFLHDKLEVKIVHLLSTYLPEEKVIDSLEFNTFFANNSPRYEKIRYTWFSSILSVGLIIMGLYCIVLYIIYTLYFKR